MVLHPLTKDGGAILNQHNSLIVFWVILIRSILKEIGTIFINLNENNILKLFFFLIFSCSSFDRYNRIAPGYQEAFVAIKLIFYWLENELIINKDLIDKIPYASSLKIGKGPTGINDIRDKRW